MDENFLSDIENIVTSLGYECVYAGIRTDFGRLKLQILIDTLGGISAGDCELVSGRVNSYIDSTGEIPGLEKGRWYLEVSSPGIERPLFRLEDYERFRGREARIRLSKLIEGRKTFTGIIEGVSGDSVVISCEGSEKEIPFSSIRGGNLVYRFGNEENDKGRRNRKGKK